MSRDDSPTASLLRLIASVGTGAVLLWHAVSMSPLQPRQNWGFSVLLLAVVAVGLVLLTALPDATRRLRRHTDLLVPLGLFVTVSTIFDSLAALPALAALLAASWPIKFLAFSLSLSAALVVSGLLTVVYVGWTTALVFQSVVQEQTNLTAPLAIMGRWFWRTLALELFGWGILFSVLTVVLTLGMTAITIALIVLGVTSLWWNLRTAALLPVALADAGPFWPALRRGMAVSRAGMGRWAPLVIAQMVLLGWITFIHVSYTTNDTNRAGSEYRSTTTEKIKSDWRVNAFWTGGYADECKWHKSLMKSLESEPLPLIERLLTLLFAVLAITIKLKIVGDLYPPVADYDVSPPAESAAPTSPEGEPGLLNSGAQSLYNASPAPAPDPDEQGLEGLIR